VDDEILDKKFTNEISSYLDSEDRDYISGYDVEDQSIYLLYIDEWKTFKMIDFFKRNHLLVKYELVSNVIDLINSDEKYFKFYSDERNKEILDNYILNNVTIDDVLDRINENRSKTGFSLLPIERKILETTGR
jgi:hypothetical protein